jgi:hypothetical protein
MSTEKEANAIVQFLGVIPHNMKRDCLIVLRDGSKIYQMHATIFTPEYHDDILAA